MPARSATSANFTEFARDGAFQPVAPIASAAPVIRSNSRRENSLDRLIRKVFTVQKRRTPNHVPYSTRPAARKASSLVFAKIVLQILATTCALCAGCYDSEARDFSSKLHRDRKSTRLNSSHGYISYAVFCLKKKKTNSTLSFTRTHHATCWYLVATALL